MGLEISTFIDGLNEDWPTPEDFRREGDDHIRLVKGTLLRTFPNVAGEVSLSHTQLNALLPYVADVESNLIGAQALIPTGVVVMWSGGVGSVPTGWALCDGTNGTPDLRGRFIVGAGGDYASGDTGGATEKYVEIGSHTHTVTVESHTLTASQMPSHKHSGHVGFFERRNETNPPASFPSGPVIPGVTGWQDEAQSVTDVDNPQSGELTQATGGGGGHSHGASADSANLGTKAIDVRPSYFALAYIMKTAPTPITPVTPPGA